MSVTIHDVARHAGVSISTVSRVLNDTAPVQEDKRRLVLRAARALGYSPNPAALSLLSKQTGGLGVLLPFVNGEFFSELLSAMDGAAQEHGRFLVISTSHRHPDEFRKAMGALHKRVDGLVVMAPELDAEGTASLLLFREPVAFINTYAEGLVADVLNFDNFGGARALTQHLLGLGHRRIALVAGPPAARDAQERARGYRAAMAEAGVSDTSALEFAGGYTREAGFEAAEQIARAAPRPTAVLAANDYCALGVVSALHKLDVVVPDEIAVAGFDGLPSTQYAVPPLTTVRVPIGDIGSRVIHRLVALLEGDDADPPMREVVPVKLLARESTTSSVQAQARSKPPD